MSGIGSSALRELPAGRRLTRAQAMLAKCSDCCGDYVDCKRCCLIPSCPLCRWQPYRKNGENGLHGEQYRV
jgi:hypothetical protein